MLFSVTRSLYLSSIILSASGNFASADQVSFTREDRKNFLVSGVSGSGELTVVDGNGGQSRIKLWALKFGDVNSLLEPFLLGRVVSCLELKVVGDGLIVADCLAAPSGLDELISVPPSKRWLDLFHWLPQLGVAVQYCAETDDLIAYDKFMDRYLACYSSKSHEPIRVRRH